MSKVGDIGTWEDENMAGDRAAMQSWEWRLMSVLKAGAQIADEDSAMEALSADSRDRMEIVAALGQLLRLGAISQATESEPIRIVDELRYLDSIRLDPVRGSEMRCGDRRYVYLRKLRRQGLIEVLSGTLRDSGGMTTVSTADGRIEVLSGLLPDGRWHSRVRGEQ